MTKLFETKAINLTPKPEAWFLELPKIIDADSKKEDLVVTVNFGGLAGILELKMITTGNYTITCDDISSEGKLAQFVGFNQI